MVKEQAFQMDGKVTSETGGCAFLVESELGLISCKVSGKLRTRKIWITVGDLVQVEVSPYDTSRGRIIKRL